MFLNKILYRVFSLLSNRLFVIKKISDLDDITNQIKGYSSSFYGHKNDIKCIIIYLQNKKHINLPRYLYWNYSKIEPALNLREIPFLGNELFYSKNIIFRAYRFDE